MSLSVLLRITGLASVLLVLSACAEWQTTPTAVDDNFGLAVSNMIENQTLYPEHGQEFRQDLLIDGQKAEFILKGYRAPVTDLREAKERIEIEIDSGSR